MSRDWSVVLLDPQTGGQLAFEGWQTISISENFDGVTVTVDVPASAPVLGAVRELMTDLLFYFDHDLIYRVRVLNAQDSLTTEDHTVSLDCVDYARLLSHRVLFADSVQSKDQHLWAWDFIAYTQNFEDLGIRQADDFAASGQNRDRVVQKGKTIVEAIDELASTDNGFDWWIDQFLRFHAQTPRRLFDIGLDLLWGAGAAALTRANAVDTYASVVFAIGATSETTIPGGGTYPPPTPVIRELATKPYGRWERTVSLSDIVTDASLESAALWHLADSSTLRPQYTVELTHGVWLPVIRPGGMFTLRVDSRPRLHLKVLTRVETVSLNLETDGVEQVSLGCRAEEPEIALSPPGPIPILPPQPHCTDVLTEPFNDLSSWTPQSTTPTIVTGRTGTAVQTVGNGRVDYTIPTLNESDTVTIGFAYRATVVTAAQRWMVGFWSDTNTVQHVSLRHEGSDGRVRVYMGASTVLAASAPGVIIANTWQYVEFQTKLHDTTGYIIVRVNGTEVINLGALNTKNAGTKTVFDTVRLGQPTIGNTNLYDDLYLSTGVGCVFKGDPLVVAPCTDVLSEPFNNFTDAPWTLVNGPTIIAGGRTASGAEFVGAITRRTATYTIPAPSESDTVTVGFAWKASSFALAAAEVIELRSDAAATQHIRVLVRNTGQIEVLRGGVQLALVAHDMTAATFAYIELQVRLHDTLGSVVLRINGVEKVNLSGVDTKNAGTKATFDTVRLSSTASGVTVVIDDLYLSTGPGCAFQGDHTIILPGTCADVLAEPFDDFTSAPWAVTSTPAIVAGRTGTAAELNSSGDQLDYTIPAPNISPHITVGFAYKTNLLIAQDLIAFYRAGAVETRLSMDNSGRLTFARASTGVVGPSASNTITTNTWYYVEVQWFSHDSTGFVIVRVNGIPVLSGSALDTRVVGDPDQIRLIRATSVTHQWDDLYISTGVGCAFKGDHPI